MSSCQDCECIITKYKYQVATNHIIAEDSGDHINPRGVYGLYSNAEFCKAILSIKPNAKILDLGCAGGTMVKTFLDYETEAIGLDGSFHAYDKERPSDLPGEHEWFKLPGNLFNCDITKPFTIFRNGLITTFDLITCYEVLEHIDINSLDELFTNIRKTLNKDGLFLGSIADHDAVNHINVHDADWWKEKFKSNGFNILGSEIFDGPWMRGKGLWVIGGPTEGFNFLVNLC